MWMKLGMLPRRSSSVCIFTAALVESESAPMETATGTGRWWWSPKHRSCCSAPSQAVVGIKLSRLGNQPVSELCVNAPVARLVGIGQRRPPHRFAKAHVVELRSLRRQADLDIAQALSIGQLSKRHRAVLLGTVQRSHPSVAAVARNNPCEGAPRQKIHELSEKRFAGVHGLLLGKAP